MGQGFYDERRRRSQLLRVMTGLLLLAATLAMLALSYMVGAREQALELERQQRDLQEHRVLLDHERQARAEVTAERDAALRDASALRLRIQNEVPVGAAKQMLDLARERLTAGVRPERIASALQRAENARNCEPVGLRRVTVKLPMVLTPSANPPPTAGARAAPAPVIPQPTTISEQLTLLIEGQAGQDANGLPLQTFDPAAPIHLRFVSAGAKLPDIEGKLPFSHVLFTNSWEYRLALSAAPRGQVTLVVERCPFP
jgi:hypothetical protein